MPARPGAAGACRAARRLMTIALVVGGAPLTAWAADPDAADDYGGQLHGSYDVAWAVAVDDAGATYAAGYTDSRGFPTANAAQPAYGGGGYDAFVVKLDAAGRLVYGTYLGGEDEDRAYGLAVDGAGAAYVAGYTHSADFPASGGSRPAAGDKDAFVVKLAPDGRRVLWAMRLGGAARDQGRAVALAPGGDVVVAGSSDSLDFPVVAALQPRLSGRRDAFVARLGGADGAVRWATLLGGGRDELAFGVAVDGEGRPTVAGYTASADFPLAAAAQSRPGGSTDAFVARLDADGRGLVWSTFLGGAGAERAAGVTVDASGAAFLTGYSESADFPADSAAGSGSGRAGPGGGRDAFAAKVAPDGRWAWRTVIGGRATDHAFAIAIGAGGTPAVAGYSRSTDFPGQPARGDDDPDDGDAFVIQLDGAGRVVPGGGRLAGSLDDRAYALAAGRGGSLHVAGYSYSPDLAPIGAFRTVHAGGRDVLVGVVAAAADADRANGSDAGGWRFSTLIGGRGNGPGAIDRADIDAGAVDASELVRQGAVLFHAPWRGVEGRRPDAPAPRTAGGAVTGPAGVMPPPPVPFYRRVGGPEAQACVGCHNQLVDRDGLVRLVSGGAGDGAANVVALPRGLDGAVERNPKPVFGSAVKARLAAEMSAALAASARTARERAAARGQPVVAVLAAKGVGFGALVAHPDGTLDTRGVVGIDADLVVKPFGAKGTLAGLDEVVAGAAASHLGLAIGERPARGSARPADGAARLTPGDTAALVGWIASRPPPGWWAPEGDRAMAVVGRGEAAFAAIGCAGCHVPSLPGDGAPAVALYSDLRRHRMGAALGDPRPEGGVPADVFLTAPLWGAGSTGPWLHDGRAATLDEAVLWHGGAAGAARDRFAALPPADRAAVVDFLTHLVVEPAAADGATDPE